MHHFYFPTKTSWISSGSNKITGTPETDQNFGQDEILEVKSFFITHLIIQHEHLFSLI